MCFSCIKISAQISATAFFKIPIARELFVNNFTKDLPVCGIIFPQKRSPKKKFFLVLQIMSNSLCVEAIERDTLSKGKHNRRQATFLKFRSAYCITHN